MLTFKAYLLREPAFCQLASGAGDTVANRKGKGSDLLKAAAFQQAWGTELPAPPHSPLFEESVPQLTFQSYLLIQKVCTGYQRSSDKGRVRLGSRSKEGILKGVSDERWVGRGCTWHLGLMGVRVRWRKWR